MGPRNDEQGGGVNCIVLKKLTVFNGNPATG
jgi:hypothetical protein